MKTITASSISRQLRPHDAGSEGEPHASKLARLIAAYAPHDGTFDLRIPGLHVSRFSRLNEGCVHGVQVPSVCFIAQGAKTIIVGQDLYEYDATRMLVFSVALPVAAQVTKASQSEPYLAFRMDLDPQKIAELVLKVYPQGVPPVKEKSAVYVSATDMGIVSAAARLVECLAQPGDAELIAPLITDEILVRLLRSPIGARVAQIGFAESSVQRVAKAISWLRANFSQPMRVEELAGLVHMSVSSFHDHFKSVTSMSPLHYQKVLRLQEARRLMLSAMADASAASRRVGYLSASQFSREYSRFFGCAPTKDIAKLRGETGSWTPAPERGA
ncbi:MAG TPA: AraC family transcriptional regulator [Candidatus Aquilonibacter sp.]|nr:AraC family transcriptional regulator [Candidatus Aquilonibacter sp.]